ncbi:hypothetical protein SAMN05444365_105289 [Micromonospora pattaloongensis]|uniref:Uncharacterized protein n=1 Tax=Micromonospora pattaloongensis TaxID=405436 RepID=A0A1H3Q7L8_9ACTN|nr:hypothetical protein SAMN05444365_105289 [Micromonospora pattaloongensis]
MIILIDMITLIGVWCPATGPLARNGHRDDFSQQ